MMSLIIIQILVSCNSLREITAVRLMVRACHTVPTSFVLATVRLKAY